MFSFIVVHVEFSVAEVIVAVGLGDFAQNPARISNSNNVWRNVLCDHAASSDHDIVSDCYARHDARVSANPNIVSAQKWNYPLHLGLTEAGTKDYSLIKSSAALGTLLNDGIGDTIRISISDDCVEEIKAAKKLLKAFDLAHNVPDLVSCPTCGRLQYDVLPVVHEIEEFLETVNKDIKVAIMGCAVNGPGESRDADIGIAGGVNEGILFKHGEVVRKVKQEDLVRVLKEEILNY